MSRTPPGVRELKQARRQLWGGGRSRIPIGMRELKHVPTCPLEDGFESHPSRGARIETRKGYETGPQSDGSTPWDT